MPPHKPVVGDNVYKTESGIVAGWWLRLKEANKPLVMYPYMWDLVGQRGVEVILGKKSGRDSIADRLKSMGLNLSEEKINKILEQVKEESLKKKSSLSDNDFKKIVNMHK
jgi:isopropylmalate/homocitrate/citramalate synthase